MSYKPKYKKSILSLAIAASCLLMSPVINATANGLALDISRDLAFSALAGGVVVLDVATPSDPLLVSEAIRTQGVVQDVFYPADKELLYISAEDGWWPGNLEH